MFTEVIQPRFTETDALGHINNTVIPQWFEKARDPIFRFFTPDLDPKDWHLIIARIEVDYKAEVFYNAEVEIKTWFSRIGNSSMEVMQQVVQGDRVCAEGKAVLIHYDWNEKKPKAIDGELRMALEAHLVR